MTKSRTSRATRANVLGGKFSPHPIEIDDEDERDDVVVAVVEKREVCCGFIEVVVRKSELVEVPVVGREAVAGLLLD